MSIIKILILSPYYYPEQIASSHLTDDLERAIIESGSTIEIYTPTPTRGITDNIYKKYKNIKYEEKYNGAIRIYRFPMFREGKNPILRAIRYIMCNIIQYYMATHAKDIDLVYSSSTPPTQGYLSGKVAKKLSSIYGKKVPFVYNLQDVFPESLVNAGITSQGSLIWQLGRIIENFSYKNAEKIITISDGWGKILLEKNVPRDKIEVVYNWGDENNVYPIKKEDNKVLKKYNLSSTDFYVTHCGNMGMSQSLDTVLDAAKDILKTANDIKFIFVGNGVSKEALQERVEKESINNVLFIPFQDEKDLAHVMSMGDISIVSSKKNVGLSSLPSKTWNILSAGRPVLCAFDKESDLQKIVEKNQLGICIEPDDSVAFKAAVLNAYVHRDMFNTFGENGRKFVENNITKEFGTKRYLDIIYGCINN